MSEEVREMFARIAKRYDVMNSLLSMGMHRQWKRLAVELSGVSTGMSVLDCASGTGDLAIEFKRRTGMSGRVLATDFCQPMLDYVQPKSIALGMDLHVELADVTHLAYASCSFDIVSIAYGIRNVDDPIAALSEMARVTKSGGKLVILETGVPSGLAKLLYNLYVRVIPIMGLLIAGDWKAYRYLPETASRFPYGNEFSNLLRKIPDVKQVVSHRLMLGASYIYVADISH